MKSARAQSSINAYSAPGQNIAEYTLIAALIAVVSLASVTFLGKNIQALLASGNAKPAPPRVAAAASSAIASASSAATSVGMGKATTVGVTATTGALSANSFTSNAPMLPSNLEKSIEASGANGTTTILADNLAAIGQRLLAEGRIDQQTANVFASLANQGHLIAQAQSVVEQIAKASGNDVDMFTSTPVTFNGQTYPNAYALSKQFAVYGENSEKGPRTGDQLAQFQSLEAALNNTAIMSDPVVKQTVGALTQQIETIANELENTAYNIGNKDAGAPSDVATLTASRVTRTDSVNICSIGGSKDIGAHCP